MNWRISAVIIIFVLSACESKQLGNIGETRSEKNSGSHYLIEIDDFKENKELLKYKIIDFRRKAEYEEEHITGALNIWRTDIEDSTYPYGGMMPSRKQLESVLGNLGISTNDTILIYDDNGLCDAARLWWILENYSFANMKLLHGGLSNWKEKGGETSKRIPKVKRAIFKLPEIPSMKYYISKQDMEAALSAETVILDTRSVDEYSGKRQKKGATKGGRIPNSRNLDWAEAINYKSDKKIKEVAQLERLFAQLNLTKEDPVITYCHSGVRSAHTTFVLTQLLGYKNVKNYDGSWTEWSYYDELPFKKDSITHLFK